MIFLFFLLICCISSPSHALPSFTLITHVYNEVNEQRRQEYITCLEKNLAHPAIKQIHVVYDTAKDTATNPLHEYLLSKNVTLSYCHDRPPYQHCFELANTNYPNQIVILANADIYFNETLNSLEGYDLTNIFLALTRWDVQEDGSLELFKQYKPDGSFDSFASYLSMDAWIFQTPLRAFKDATFRMCTWACDGYIAYQAYISGLQVVNPCLSIQCCHLHLVRLRSWIPQSIPGAKAMLVPWSKLA